MSQDVSNYPLRSVYAEHFRGPISGEDNGFRTVPTLLRAVADWMDQNDIQDPEFFNLDPLRPARAEGDPTVITTIYWDRRNGINSYPYPHNGSHGAQQCPICLATVRVLEIACDYYPSRVTCQCGVVVECPGIEDRGRFSGLETITRAAEGRPPVAPGQVPVNCSESVREEFESMARTEIYG